MRAWWDAEARPRQAYLLAGLLGLAVFLVVYGPGHLFGTSAYWDLPQEDSRAYLMGYRYFLHEPWQWPIFTSHTINLPETKSMALSDGIPIWALVNKVIATVIPPWREVSTRAYLGTWHLLCHVLQACLGVAIVRLSGRRTRGEAILAAIFFLAVPSWIFRYQHAALDAHFLILWSIYLYLRTPIRGIPPTKLQLAWLAELAICAMTNPYHVVMSFGFFVAALIRSRRLRALAWLPAALAAIAFAAWIAGYLARVTTTPMGGFEIYSTNVTSMFVPPNSGILGDARGWFGELHEIHNQYEGQVYLGLGVLVLFALFLPHARTLGGVIKRHAGLFAFALGIWLFALSNHIYFNSTRVFAYEVPASLRFVTVLFRAPGRFAWVPMYVVIVFLVTWGLRRFTSGWRRLVLPALAIVQLVDASGDWRHQHANTRGPIRQFMTMEPWQALVAAHERVYELPTYDCLSDQWPKLGPALEIAFLASERVLPINGVYGARPVRDCVADTRTRFAAEPDATSLYVWFTQTDRFARRFVAKGAACAGFMYGWVCSKHADAIERAIASGDFAPMAADEPAAPVLAEGQHVGSGTPELLVEGWSWPEATGRWSDGAVATARFRFAMPPTHAVMKLRVATVLCGRRRSQDVGVSVNDVLVATLHFDATTNDVETVRSIPIPDAVLQVSRDTTIDFASRDVRPPSTVHCNADTRHTGIWLRDLWFEPQ